MPGIGTLIASAVQGVVSALLSPITAWLHDRAQRQQGAAEQRAADQKSELEIRDAQLRAAVDRPDTAADLNQRLRTGKF